MKIVWFSAVRFDIRRLEPSNDASWAVCIGYDRTTDFGLFDGVNDGPTEEGTHETEGTSVCDDDDDYRVDFKVKRSLSNAVSAGFSLKPFL